MNFEHLYKKFLKKKMIFFIYKLKLKEYHIQKLKIGSLTFEIKEHLFLGFKIFEIIDIRYTKQDNTQEDSYKIDNRLNALKWKWDVYNILSLFIIISVLIFFLYFHFYGLFMEKFSFLFYKYYSTEIFLKTINDLLFNNNLSFFKNFNYLNFLLSETLFNLCNYYNILK
jgi:hypothetical protein